MTRLPTGAPPERTKRVPRRAPLRTLLLGIAAAVILLRLIAPFLVGDALVSAAARRPSLIDLPLVGDLIVERLGARVTSPAGSDTTLIKVTIPDGAGTAAIGTQLVDAHLLGDQMAFIVAVHRAGLEGRLQAGQFLVAASMTPTEVATALTTPYHEPTIAVELRPALRLEQIVAKISTIDLPFKASDVLHVLQHPSAGIIAAYPWLDLATGATLEGRLGSGTFNVPISTDATGFVRLLLDRFADQVPVELRGPTADGRSLSEVLTLASIVEREASLDSERARIAGVFAYRMQQQMGLGSDVTLLYMLDGAYLRSMSITSWKNYSFWSIPQGLYARSSDPSIPKDLRAWNTRANRGLPPGPICTPSTASIIAARAPDSSRKELYFIAIPGGGGTVDYSTTLAEHLRKARAYGFNP